MRNIYRDINKEITWQGYVRKISEACSINTDDYDNIVKWFELHTPQEQCSIYEELRSDSTVTDIWQARYKLMEYINNNIRINTKTDSILEKIGIKPISSENTPRIIGNKLLNEIEIFMKRIVASLASGKGGIFILIGPPESGKTIIADYLINEFSKQNYSAFYYDEIFNHRKVELNENADIIIIDDADYEFTFNSPREFLKILKKSKHKPVCIMTCSDISKLNNVLSCFSYRCMSIPEYNNDDICRILSDKSYNGYKIHPDSARSIVHVLHAIRERNTLKTAIEMCNYIITTESDDIDILDSMLFFPKTMIIGALYACTGRVIASFPDTLYDDLQDRLKDKIIGQDDVIDAIIPALINIKTGLSDPGRPAAVFLAVGPTGVGKTELGKAISEILYDGVFHKEDMNTYFEKHMAAKLLGAPPGYSGSSEIPAMLQFVKNNSSGVIIFDEFEKAHYSIKDTIMEMLDTGFMRDSMGREYDFRGFFILMTSNILFEGDHKEKPAIGFEKSSDKNIAVSLNKKLVDSGYFNDSFMSRISCVEFKPLMSHHVEKIAFKLLDTLLERMEKVGIMLDDIVSDECAEIIDDIIAHYDAERGARSMRLFVEFELKNYLLEKLKHQVLEDKSVPKKIQI